MNRKEPLGELHTGFSADDATARDAVGLRLVG